MNEHFEKFRLDLNSQMEKFKEKNNDFDLEMHFLSLRKENEQKTARIKLLGGFNFANERSQTFSRNLISRKYNPIKV